MSSSVSSGYVGGLADKYLFFNNASAAGYAWGEVDSGTGSYWKAGGLTFTLTAQVGFAAYSGAKDVGELLLKDGCFTEGTPIQMADGTTKPIEQIREGDLVLSRDQHAGADGKVVAARVTRTYQHQVDHTVVVTLSSGERIECTDNHPFFVRGLGWVPAGRLCLGTLLSPRAGPAGAGTLLGMATVTSVERCTAKAGAATTVYNFEVQGTHTYFVGTDNGGEWVHNDCTAEEIAAVIGNWAKGTFPSVEESIQYHFNQHGFGLSLQEYTDMANQLWSEGQGSAIWRQWQTGQPEAFRIFGIGNETGTYNAVGQILSYWRN